MNRRPLYARRPTDINGGKLNIPGSVPSVAARTRHDIPPVTPRRVASTPLVPVNHYPHTVAPVPLSQPYYSAPLPAPTATVPPPPALPHNHNTHVSYAPSVPPTPPTYLHAPPAPLHAPVPPLQLPLHTHGAYVPPPPAPPTPTHQYDDREYTGHDMTSPYCLPHMHTAPVDVFDPTHRLTRREAYMASLAGSLRPAYVRNKAPVAVLYEAIMEKLYETGNTVKDMFLKLDYDRTGRISLYEFQAKMRSLNIDLHIDEIRDLFHHFTSGDYIAYDSFIEFVERDLMATPIARPITAGHAGF